MVAHRSRSKDRRRKKSSGSSSSSDSSSSRSRSSSSGSSSSGSSSSGSSRSGGSSSRSSSRSANRNKQQESRKKHEKPRSKSKSPRRRKRSPTPKPTKVHIGRLTRNVTKDHVTEIFSVYGKIKSIEMPIDRLHSEFSRLFAYVDYEKAEDAEAAVDHMDGGMIDKHEISVKGVIEPKSKKKKLS